MTEPKRAQLHLPGLFEFYQDVVNEVWDMSRWTTKIF